MKKIGILSDTHGTLLPSIVKFLEQCDEIWHAGDIGSMEVVNQLREISTLRAVFGNIDGGNMRAIFNLYEQFMCENTKVIMTHIGGYPGNYDKYVRPILEKEKPDIFICGHSHILKVIFDKKLKLLHINPGAAGRNGFHKVCTAIRFEVHGKEFKNLEILEIDRSKLPDLS